MPPDSIDDLVAAYGDRLLGRIRWMMGPAARRQAESGDLLQQVFTVAVASREQLRPLDDAARLRWLTATARNRVRESVRSRREQALESLSATVPGRAPSAASADDPVRRAEREEHVEQLVECLESLKPEHRDVIELRDFEGLSFKVIGERMERSEDAVQMLHSRALLRLGEQMRRRSGSD